MAYVRDRVAKTTQAVGVLPDGQTYYGHVVDITADGTSVLFAEQVEGGGSCNTPTYLRNRITHTSVQVTGATGHCDLDPNALIRMSSNGRYVAFDSGSSGNDVYRREIATGTTIRISVNAAGVAGDAFSFEPVIDADGGTVGFSSLAENLVTSAPKNSLSVYARVTG